MSPEFTLFGLTFHWYGIIIACGVMLGVLIAMRRSRYFGLDPDTVIDFGLMAIPMAIIGARLYYVIFEWDSYKGDPIRILYIWEGGLAIYGGVLAAILAGIIFTKWRKIDFWSLADLGSPCLILGQAIGRWGNFINQEAYGYAVENPALQWFPFAVYITDGMRPGDHGWFLATFFYESMWNFLVFLFLLYYTKKRKRAGEVFLLYLILYSAGRIVIEGLRTDSLMFNLFGTEQRVSQWLSGLLIIIGVAIFIYRRKNAAPIVAAVSGAETHAQPLEPVDGPADSMGTVSSDESKVETPAKYETEQEDNVEKDENESMAAVQPEANNDQAEESLNKE